MTINTASNTATEQLTAAGRAIGCVFTRGRNRLSV